MFWSTHEDSTGIGRIEDGTEDCCGGGKNDGARVGTGGADVDFGGRGGGAREASDSESSCGDFLPLGGIWGFEEDSGSKLRESLPIRDGTDGSEERPEVGSVLERGGITGA